VDATRQDITEWEHVSISKTRHLVVDLPGAKLHIACQDLNIPCFSGMRRRSKHIGGVGDSTSIADTENVCGMGRHIKDEFAHVFALLLRC
jgi:hypothetical protein